MQETRDDTMPAAYDLFVAALATAAITLMTLRMTLDDFDEKAILLDKIDYGICALFFMDFIRSLIREKRTWRYLYTWGWLDLLSSIPVIPAFRYLRFARILRVLRIIRSLKMLVKVIKRDRPAAIFALIIFSGIILFSMICVGVLSYEADAPGATIKTADDVLWWAIVTCSTVGYGDEYPVTEQGRTLAALLMVIGIGAFATATTALGVFFKRIQPNAAQQSQQDNATATLESIESRLSRIESMLSEREHTRRTIESPRELCDGRTNRPGDRSDSQPRCMTSFLMAVALKNRLSKCS